MTYLTTAAAKADTLLKRWAAMADALDDRISYNERGGTNGEIEVS